MLLQSVLLAAGSAAALLAPGAPTASDAPVALRAGKIHLVEGGQVIENGTILVKDGAIVAVGADVALPRGTRVVDYGPDAVIVPGLIAAGSPFGFGAPSRRTATFTLRAEDNFDPYSSYAFDLAGGVTAAYLSPTNARLVGGLGAVVKLAGEDPGARVVRSGAAVDGTITENARQAPGYWDPPVPATADVGLGVEQRQLPLSLMGATVALRELFDIAERGASDFAPADEYGPTAGAELAQLLKGTSGSRGTRWIVGADSAQEIRALLATWKGRKVPLVLRGGREAGELAAELVGEVAGVIVEVDGIANRGGRDLGTSEDVDWPRYDIAVKLHEAGVPFAIAPTGSLRPRDLRYAARLASRGGLSEEGALRAITLSAAELLGVADRVGSIAAGKDADFVVLSGAPLDPSTGVLASWVGGESSWTPPESAKQVVISVEELYVGDGTVLAPGELLLRDGRIAEVGRRVAHPPGATVVRGFAASPGMIDGLGRLGLQGSSKTPSTDFKLAQVLGPGDRTDRRVAKAGLTTVVLRPQGQSSSGVPMAAYKPAGTDLDTMMIADPAALALDWSDRNRADAGDNVRKLLEKAVEYRDKWIEYEKAIAAWTPPPPEASEAGDAQADDEKKPEEEQADDDKKDEKKGKKKKKDEDPQPIQGIWETDLAVEAAEEVRESNGPADEPRHMRLRLERPGSSPTEPSDATEVLGNLRCGFLSSALIELEGTFVDGTVTVRGLGSRGWVTLVAKNEDGKLVGTVAVDGAELEFSAERTTRELKWARRTVALEEPPEEAKPPKGMPRSPGIDSKLEPLRQAMAGERAVVVGVEREDEVLACVAAFEAAGIRPILYEASGAWKVADQIRGRVAGILLSPTVLSSDPRKGLASLRNRYADLAAAGIPVAFHSAAEEGAGELPLLASYAVSQGMSPEGALRALTADVADMYSIEERVGRLKAGLDADVLLLDGRPLDPATSVLRVWVSGEEVR